MCRRPLRAHDPGVDTYLEVSSAVNGGRRHLVADRLVVGRSPLSDVVLAADAQVSRSHAVLERIAGRWVVRDVGSRNGTYVNGERVREPVRLAADDEIRVGKSRLVLKVQWQADDPGVTERQAPPPLLTAREREVLVAVVRPLIAGPFGQPASIAEIAGALWVSDAAVKRHLVRLYLKFGIDGRGAVRQARLATAALQRGAITVSEVQQAAGMIQQPAAPAPADDGAPSSPHRL
jgi:pSer/pThr/pTyr-binding forkhead associated (FHA) protein